MVEHASKRDDVPGGSVVPKSAGFRWARVLIATAAVHVLGVVLSVAFIVAYSVVTLGAPVEGFAGPLSTGILPVLTLPAAVWVARGARRPAAATHGLIVGLVVAGTLALLFFWPHDLQSVALSAAIVVAGFLGGLLGGAIRPRR